MLFGVHQNRLQKYNNCVVLAFNSVVARLLDHSQFLPPLLLMNSVHTQEHGAIFAAISLYIKVFYDPCPSMNSAAIPTNPAYS